MGWSLPKHSQVISRCNNTATSEMMPNPIDHYTSRQRILGIDQPLCQQKSSTADGDVQRLAIQCFQELPWSLFTGRPVITSHIDALVFACSIGQTEDSLDRRNRNLLPGDVSCGKLLDDLLVGRKQIVVRNPVPKGNPVGAAD